MIGQMSSGSTSHVTSSMYWPVIAKRILHFMSIFIFTSSWSQTRGYGCRFDVISKPSFWTKLIDMRFFYQLVAKIAPMTLFYLDFYDEEFFSNFWTRPRVGFKFITFGLAINDIFGSAWSARANLVESLTTIVVVVHRLWLFLILFFEISSRWIYPHFYLIRSVIIF